MYKPYKNHPRPANKRRNRHQSDENIDPRLYVRAAENKTEEVEEVTSNFSDFNLNPTVLANIKSMGYNKPTPVQDKAMRAILEGKDVVAIANTGTGKTGGFLLPTLTKLADNKRLMALVLVPTRELAAQVVEECNKYARGLGIRAVSIVGGVNMYGQIQDLKRNPQVVVATPGRLKDLAKRNTVDLRMFEIVILDEVDRMVDIGFLPDVKILVAQLGQPRQSLFFSATITPAIQEVLGQFSKDPVVITTKKTETASLIDQDVVTYDKENKFDKLVSLLDLKENFKVILFTRTKRGADELGRNLYKSRVRAEIIHGNKTQGARMRALDNFKRDRAQVLVATDVAARGIDIPRVDLVVNYDEPATYADYVHRIGRTGRAGKTGRALTFVLDSRMARSSNSQENRYVNNNDRIRPSFGGNRQRRFGGGGFRGRA